MFEQNGIPLFAVAIELIVSIFLFTLATESLKKYQDRHSSVSYYLVISFFCLAMGTLSSGTGKLIVFTSSSIILEIAIVDFTRIIGYIFICISNMYFGRVLLELFLSEDSQYPLFLVLGNSIAIGMLLKLLFTPEEYTNGFLIEAIFVLVLTFSIHLIISYFAFSESKKNTEKTTIRGFQLIALFSIAGLVALTFFVIEASLRLWIDLQYSPIYYLGWLIMGVGAFSAYLGYLMPTWFKNRLS